MEAAQVGAVCLKIAIPRVVLLLTGPLEVSSSLKRRRAGGKCLGLGNEAASPFWQLQDED